MSLFRAAPAGALPTPIFRIGSKKYGVFHSIPLDERPLFVTTHYVKGMNTQPCIGTGCKWCHTGEEGEKPQPRRERAYIGILMVERKLRGVLELTERAGVDLLEMSKTQPLIGLLIKCGRAGEKNTSPLKLEPQDKTVNVQHLLHDWDLQAALCATWGIENPSIAGKLHAPEEFAARGHDLEDIHPRSLNGKGRARA